MVCMLSHSRPGIVLSSAVAFSVAYSLVALD
jgi:hypothetical protein